MVQRHAEVLDAARGSARRDLALLADWAIGRGGAFLVGTSGVVAAVLRAFGAGSTAAATGGLAGAVTGLRTDLPATAITEALMAAGAGAGDWLAAGSRVDHRIAAQGAG